MQPEEQQQGSEVASLKEDTRKNKAIILTKFLVKPSEIVSPADPLRSCAEECAVQVAQLYAVALLSDGVVCCVQIDSSNQNCRGCARLFIK